MKTSRSFFASDEYLPSVGSITDVVEPNRAGKTRCWTPLKYPRSAFFSDENKRRITPFFPYHPDILRAAIRELLILAGRLDHRTLKVPTGCPTESQTESIINNPSSEGDALNDCSNPKRKSNPIQESENNQKRARIHRRGTQKRNNESSCDQEVDDNIDPVAAFSAEELVSTILHSLLLASPAMSTIQQNLRQRNEAPSYSSPAARRPRRIPEEPEQMTETPKNLHEEVLSPDNISFFLDVSENDSSKAFTIVDDNEQDVPPMLQVSISDEAHLRHKAMEMTKRLVRHFDGKSLGLFFGYKSPSANQDRFAELLSSFLFDTSHAMFAWIQTEQDFLFHHRQTDDLDLDIQELLFDQRAIDKIGGLKPRCILPQAVSIRRLRRRNTTWEKFSATAQCQRMFNHCCKEKNILAAGKERRGQRLRQRHWLTSNSPIPEHDECQTLSTSRSRSSSLVSEADLIEEPVSRQATMATCFARQTRILSDIAGSKAISLTKNNPLQSWGVGLLQEGRACIVGKARSHDEGLLEEGVQLCCGDMILFVHNDRGEYAAPPICSWSESQHDDEEWFGRIVNVFKTSTELHLVIQRA